MKNQVKNCAVAPSHSYTTVTEGRGYLIFDGWHDGKHERIYSIKDNETFDGVQIKLEPNTYYYFHFEYGNLREDSE